MCRFIEVKALQIFLKSDNNALDKIEFVNIV